MQAYIDDSTEAGSVLVLAGYIATVPQWVTFTEMWQRALNGFPGTGPFKMNKLKQKHHRPRVELHYSIIEQTVSGGVCIAVPIDSFKKVCAEFSVGPRYSNPYYMAWILTISVFRQFYTEANWTSSVEITFDIQKEENFVTEAWHLLKEKQNGDTDPIKKAPRFKDDKEVLPLQAADFLAWWARKAWIKNKTFKNIELFPWDYKCSTLPYLFAEMGEEGMRRHLQNTVGAINFPSGTAV